MTDLERARSELLDIVACARDGLWTLDLIERLDEAVARQIDTLLAAARREGAEEARKQCEAVMEAFAHRMKQTGAEEMRERAARECEEYMTSQGCAAAIRALPLTPEEPT